MLVPASEYHTDDSPMVCAQQQMDDHGAHPGNRTTGSAGVIAKW